MEEKNDDLSRISVELREKLKKTKELQNTNHDINSIMKDIWNLSKKKFNLSVKLNAQKKEYKGIIFTVGFSPEPIILSIIAINPECVYFIYTKESEKIVDTIIGETQLKPSQYKRELISKNSAADSYNFVKKGLKFLTEEKGLEKSEIALDPTGGTKIMSVGCGIAAAIFNLDILYVNNKKYDVELRRPEPGSEELVNVPNPFDIYQDDKIIEGLNYLKTLNFSRAKDLFNAIKDTSKSPLFPEFFSGIAEILYSWDAIDFSNALKFVEKTKRVIEKLEIELSPIKTELFELINSWETHLQTINEKILNGNSEVEKISPLLVFDILFNAEREFFNSNYNAAALKYYRAIEMINQYVLLNSYNIDTQNPNYEQLPENIKQNLKNSEENKQLALETIVLKLYNDVWKYIYEKLYPEKQFQESNLLINKLGLLAGLIVRSIFGEPSINKETILNVLKALELRNKSIYAHGITSISKKVCESLKKIAESMCESVKIEENCKRNLFSKKNIEYLVNLLIPII